MHSYAVGAPVDRAGLPIRAINALSPARVNAVAVTNGKPGVGIVLAARRTQDAGESSSPSVVDILGALAV